MFSGLSIFFIGMGISFLGTLPLGTLNISAMQLSIQENTRNAVKFALGVALVELIYVRLSLTGMSWVMAHQTLFKTLEWATVLLFIILSISSFRTASKESGNQKNILLNNKLGRFWLGATMSAMNPVQIPFWFIWSTYLISNHLLQPTELAYNLYLTGIGIGTITSLAVFIFAGKWIVNKLNASYRKINILVGAVFLISAGIQLYRLLNK